MKIFVSGGTGLLGTAINKSFPEYLEITSVFIGNYKVGSSKNRKYYNQHILDHDGFEKLLINNKPDVIIHTSGIADVDACEKSFKEAYDSNVIGTANIIRMCKEHNCKLIYISTNAVFEGENAPYKEEDKTNPINNYGKLKLQCEKDVINSGIDYAIVRPIFMYGWNNPNERKNMAVWIIEKIRNSEEVKIVDDVYENPLYNIECAKAILKIIEKNASGIFHIAGKDIISRYDFALKIAEVFNLNKNLIKRVNSSYFNYIAPRPYNTSYKTNKMTEILHIKPLPIEKGLLLMKEDEKEQ